MVLKTAARRFKVLLPVESRPFTTERMALEGSIMLSTLRGIAFEEGTRLADMYSGTSKG